MGTINLYGQPMVDPGNIFAASSLTASTYSATTNGFASIFAAENVAVHGAVVGALVSCSAVVGSPTFKISLQSVTSRFTPNGTAKGGVSPASKTFTPTVGVAEVDFTNSFTPSTGDLLALVCEYVSGSTSATFNRRATTISLNTFPYAAAETSSSWAASVGPPCLAPVYSDGFVGKFFCATNTLANNISSSTSYGSLWVAAANATLTGCKVGLQPNASTGGFLQATLYEGTSTTIASLTNVSQSVNMNVDIATTANSVVTPIAVPMPSYQLKAGQTYRLVITNSGTAYALLVSSSFPSLASLQSWWGPLAGTIGTTTTFTDYNSGTDWRAFPVIPCIDSYSAGGLLAAAGYCGGMAG